MKKKAIKLFQIKNEVLVWVNNEGLIIIDKKDPEYDIKNGSILAIDIKKFEDLLDLILADWTLCLEEKETKNKVMKKVVS